MYKRKAFLVKEFQMNTNINFNKKYSTQDTDRHHGLDYRLTKLETRQIFFSIMYDDMCDCAHTYSNLDPCLLLAMNSFLFSSKHLAMESPQAVFSHFHVHVFSFNI